MSTDLRRLASATLLASFAGPEVPDWLRRRIDDGLGGVCLFGSNLRSASSASSVKSASPALGRSAGLGAAASPPAAGPADAGVRAAARAPTAPADSRSGHWIRRPGTGSSAQNAGFADAGVAAAARVSAVLHAVRPSVLVALDEEGGDVTRLDAHRGSPVPGNAALGAVDDAALTRRLAHGLGLRLVEAGIDLDLAPCADANTDPANPVIGVRSFGADPALVARHVAAFVEGLQTAGVAACAKHFPGHGATTVDSHLDLPVVDAPDGVLRVRELVPFRAAIAAGVSTVMLGHLRMPAFDERAATVSHRLATGLLRDEMGFRGAVVTDALDMHGIGGPAAIPANVVRAVAAGADLCCLGSEGTDELIDACLDALVGAVRSGALDEARLADAAGHVAAVHRGWLHTPRPVPPSLDALGAEAARRALRLQGEIDAPIGPAHVVELRSVPNIAAGVVPWGVAEPLAALVPGTTGEQLDPDSVYGISPAGEISRTQNDGVPPSDAVTAVLARAEGRRLVVVLRERRRAAAAQLIADLVEVRPDAIVVDMGWLSGSETAGGPAGAHIATYGASLVSGEAVARLLAGRDVPTSVPASTAGPGNAGRSPRG